jgi:hypothetical protein
MGGAGALQGSVGPRVGAVRTEGPTVPGTIAPLDDDDIAALRVQQEYRNNQRQAMAVANAPKGKPDAFFPPKPESAGRNIPGLDETAQLLQTSKKRDELNIEELLAKTPSKMSLLQVALLSPTYARKASNFFLSLSKLQSHAITDECHSAWYLPIKVKGQTLCALVDTGSVISLMGEHCAQRLELPMDECEPLTMKLADDSNSIVRHRTENTTITVGDLSIPTSLLIIPNVAYDLILGKDFLARTKTKMWLNGGQSILTLTWDGYRQTFPLCTRAECANIIQLETTQSIQANAAIIDPKQDYHWKPWEAKQTFNDPRYDEPRAQGEQREHKHRHSMPTEQASSQATEEVGSPSRDQSMRPWTQRSRGGEPKQEETGTRGDPRRGSTRDVAGGAGTGRMFSVGSSTGLRAYDASKAASNSESKSSEESTGTRDHTGSPASESSDSPPMGPEGKGEKEARRIADREDESESTSTRDTRLGGEDMAEKDNRTPDVSDFIAQTRHRLYLKRQYLKIQEAKEVKTAEPVDQAQTIQEQLRRTLPHLFSEELGPMSRQCPVTHRIETTGLPFKSRAYRRSPKEDAITAKAIDDMLAAGIIRPSNSPWAAGVVLVPKKSGETRFCVDYKKLNDQTPKDAYPLPRPEDLLEQVAGHEKYTLLDLNSGYWQIPMEEESIPKTAFVTKYGTYEYLVMPFGLTNAPATFQRTMDVILAPFIRKGQVVVYLDDICIMSKQAQDHFDDVLEVCNVLEAYNLKIKEKKCEFAKTEIKFLGHIVNRYGTKTDPAKCTAIKQWGTPQRATDLRSFLGAVGYYRRFIPGFAEPVAKLTPLLRKHARFTWTAEHETAMKELKERMTTPPVLIPPDFRKPFLVVTDASDYAISAALIQLVGTKEHPVRYYSRTLQPAERNYSTTDREALAVVSAFKQFRVYLLGSKTTLFTDHQALKQVLTDAQPTGRRARWIAALQEFDYDIRHRPGAKNQLADTLSRDPSLRSVTIDLTKDPDADDILVDTKKYLEGDGTLRAIAPGRARTLMKLATKMFTKDGELYKRRINGPPVRVIISRTERKKLLTEVHDGLAHFGEKTTYELISNIAWWPQIQKDATEYVQTCVICQGYARLKKPEKPISIPVERLFERIALDFVGPLPETRNGNKYIIVATDALSRWPFAKAVPSADAATAARFLYDDIAMSYGIPESILTDQGTHFINKLHSQLTKILEVRHLRTTPYHPQTNGMTERFNGTLCGAIAKLAEQHQADWDLFIPAVLFAYRIRKHSALKTSPYEVVYGQPPKLPNGAILGDEYFDDNHRATQAQTLRKQASRPTVTKKSRFRLGQTVLWKAGIRRNKLEPKLYGPYVIRTVGPNNTYLLSIDNEELPALISGDHLQAYKGRQTELGRRTVVPDGESITVPPDIYEH